MFYKILTIVLQVFLTTSCMVNHQRNLYIKEKGKCSSCEGKGHVECEDCEDCEDGTERCRICEGKGSVKTGIGIEGTGFLPSSCDVRFKIAERECYDCNGTGRVPCTKCHGFRKVKCFFCKGPGKS